MSDQETFDTPLGVDSQLAHDASRLATFDQYRGCIWLGLAPGFPVLTIASLVLLLLSGIYLTAQMSGWSLAWPKIAVAIFIFLAPVGAATGRKMRAVRRASGSVTNFADLAEKMRDPFLKFSLNIRIALVLGIVLLMTAKPGLPELLGIVIASAALGIVASLLFWPGRTLARSRMASRG